MKTLVFTVKGDYARFRCAYTTTSALTYILFHPIAIKGMIGAVMGIDYSDLYEYTKDMQIGIQVLNPVYKDMQSFNLIPITKGNGAYRFQSRVEFLRDVNYRIFLSCDDNEKLTSIYNTLQTHEYVFTPYLGCTEHIAKINSEGIYEAYPINNQETHIDTVVPKEYIDVEGLTDFTVYLDRIPIKNSKSREYTEYANIIFSNDRNLIVKDCTVYNVKDYNVYLF